MSGQRYTPEFKDEAVKLITERGYSVTDVAERLGVSQHSIYKWLKAVQPLRNNPDEHELLEAKKEILRLKSQLKQTEEERDILKKAARHCCPTNITRRTSIEVLLVFAIFYQAQRVTLKVSFQIN